MATGKRRSSLAVTVMAVLIGGGFATAGLWRGGSYAVEYYCFLSGREHGNLKSVPLGNLRLDSWQDVVIAVPGRKTFYRVTTTSNLDQPLFVAYQSDLLSAGHLLLRRNPAEERLLSENLADQNGRPIWVAVESPHQFYILKLVLGLLVTGLGMAVAYGFVQKHRRQPDWY